MRPSERVHDRIDLTDGVKLLSLKELRQVDTRAVVFGGMGIRDEDPSDARVVRRHQERVAHADLVASVPDGVRNNFERLRTMHAYGALAYDLYSIVEQTHAFVFEQAIGERFLEFYDGEIPFQDKDGQRAPLRASSFQEIYRAVSRGGSHAKSRLLAIQGLAAPLEFYASFKGLHRWARAAGLLRGQRNRFREDCMRELRNAFAHPTGHSLVGPIDSARAIAVLAEIINHLWGETTPGGDRYPAPVTREVLLLGRSPDGGSRTLGYPAAMTPQQEKEGWHYFVVRAFRHDGALMESEPPFDRTNIPVDLVWGPGSSRDALMWIDLNGPAPDTVDHLDRLFLVRVVNGIAAYPVAVEMANKIEDEDRQSGETYLVRADLPLDALGHVRGSLQEGLKHSKEGYCSECPVETVQWGPVVVEAGTQGPPPEP